MGAKICASLFLRKLLYCSFKFPFVKVRKKPTVILLFLLYWSWKSALSLQKVAEFPISVQLGIWAMMHISPLSLWNKPNIMFKSNSNADKTFFAHTAFSTVIRHKILVTAFGWQHWHFLGGTCSALEFPLLLAVLCQSCCWKLSLQTRYCQKFIARLQLRFHFLQWILFSPLQLALDSSSVQISSLKAKMIYIYRDQTPPSLKTLFSVYTVISGTFPPVTINYMPLSIIKLILLILATKSKKNIKQSITGCIKIKNLNVQQMVDVLLLFMHQRSTWKRF